MAPKAGKGIQVSPVVITLGAAAGNAQESAVGESQASFPKPAVMNATVQQRELHNTRHLVNFEPDMQDAHGSPVWTGAAKWEDALQAVQQQAEHAPQSLATHNKREPMAEAHLKTNVFTVLAKRGSL
ncbi:MAG: hypothetical protein FRX49_00524 [Trebouxia sp. A1-2]|nr:MAG: hypothetical protein FRX49_00524 [Trebouxia sp. A1-2]